jgi:hypothetical protein
MRCYEVFGNGIAVCGHISVSSKTDFSFLQSVATDAGVTLVVGWRGGAQSIRGVRLTTHHLLARGRDVRNECNSTYASWRVQGKFNFTFFLL